MFNTYFASVFATDNLSDQSEEPCNMNGHIRSNSVIVSELEIETLLKTLDSKKATGPDEMPPSLLPLSISQIFTPWHGSRRMEASKCCTCIKKGEKCRCENYRPISLLLIVSKQLERCVFMNIKCHLSQSRTQSMSVRRLGACPAPNLRTGILWVRDCICPRSLASVSTGSFKVNPV